MVILELAAAEVEDFEKIGIDKLYYSISDGLKMLSIKYGRDKFRNLMQGVTFRVKQKRKLKAVFVNAYEDESKFVNRIRDIKPTNINQQWHIDITQIRFKDMNLYMTVILEGYSRKILSHVVSNTLTSKETSLKALEQGLLYGKPELIHSDRETQFTSNEWQVALNKLSIKSSYSRAGKPTDNGKIERLFSTLKTELGLRKLKADNIEEYLEKIDELVNKYNSYRTHQSLKYSTPDNIFYKQLCQPIPA